MFNVYGIAILFPIEHLWDELDRRVRKRRNSGSYALLITAVDFHFKMGGGGGGGGRVASN